MAVIRICGLLAVWLNPLPAAALCVTNGTAGELYFTVEAAETGKRIAGRLGPDEALCLADSDHGVVAAFENNKSVEGCTRLAGGGDRLLAFARFDRCTWETHLDVSKAEPLRE